MGRPYGAVGIVLGPTPAYPGVDDGGDVDERVGLSADEERMRQQLAGGGSLGGVLSVRRRKKKNRRKREEKRR